MIKKYYSKYTGKQIDEAVAALIENNIKIEDLNEEVVELINSKANEQDLAALQKEIEDNQIKVVEIPIGILQKAVNEEILTAEELAFFTSDYKIYKCAAPLEGAEELGLQMYFVTSATTDNTIALSSHLYNVIIDLTTGKVELEASVDLEMVDIKEKVSNLESRTDSLETEVSNVLDTASNAESLAYENQTAIEELQNKNNVIRCDSVGVDLVTAYNGQSIDRNLTAEEAEVFKQFVNNENLTSLYAKVEGLADVVLTKSAYLTQDSVDIISFSAVIMDCYLDALVCIYPEGSGVLGSIEISKRDLTMPKITEECPYFGDEIYALLTGSNVNDRKLTSAELDYFTNIKDKNSGLKITVKNTALQVHFYKYYTGPDRSIYRTIDENKIYSIIVYFDDDRGEEYVNTVGFDSNIFTEENEFNNLERHVDTLESTIGDIDAVLSEINGSGTTSGDSSSGGSSGGVTLLHENTITLGARTNSDNSSPAFCPLNLDFLVNYNFNEINFIIIETNIMNGSLTGKSFVEFYTMQNEGVITSVTLKYQGPIPEGQFSLVYDITSNKGFSFKYDSVEETNAIYDEALVGAQLTIKAYKY